MINTTEEFKTFVEKVKSTKGYKDPIAFGICRVDASQLDNDKVLQATYPLINWNENFGSAAVFIAALKASGIEVDNSQSEVSCKIDFDFVKECMNTFNPYLPEAYGDAHKNVQVIIQLFQLLGDEGMREGEFRVVFLFEDAACVSVEATYLKLYALSQAKAELRTVNLNGAFGALPNVAWQGNTPIDLDYLRINEIELKLRNEYPDVDFVDKFPRFLQHIIPADNTRIS